MTQADVLVLINVEHCGCGHIVKVNFESESECVTVHQQHKKAKLVH